MKEFVYGSDEQFEAFDHMLSDGLCHTYKSIVLPDTCTPQMTRIGFEKKGDEYVAYIEKGIQTEIPHTAFLDYLRDGEIHFSNMDDMKLFFHSLKQYFEVHQEHNFHVEESHPMVDRNKIHELRNNTGRKDVLPEDISEPLKKKIYGQNKVIERLSELVVLNKMRKERRTLAAVLLGPTATGKSETAKSLSEVVSVAYGRDYGYIEIAGNELLGSHMVHRFFGAPPGYVGHGQPTILEAVRKNPYHVIVINEIEKADDSILVGLMEAIDTGYLGMADNSRPIDLKNSILLFTSNVPVDMGQYEVLSDFEQSEYCRDVFTKICGRPEISGKIGNFLVFYPLDEDAVTDIIIKFISEELNSYDLKLLHIDEQLMADFLTQQTKYGARGIRDLVGNIVGKKLLRESLPDGNKHCGVELKGTLDNIELSFI